MKKNKKDEGGLWTAKFSEVVASLQVLEKNGFTRGMLDYLRGPGGNNMAQEIITLFYDPSINCTFYESTVEEWELFYKKYFDIEVNFSKIKVPRPRQQFSRLLVIASELPLYKIISVMEKRFSVIISPSDCSIDATINEREMNYSPYAIWVRDGVEPEADYLSRSAEWMYNCPKESETLKERLIHGLKYWDENKKLLDIEKITLCSGSKSIVRMIPCVSGGGILARPEIKIFWVKHFDSSINRGPREVISCSK